MAPFDVNPLYDRSKDTIFNEVVRIFAKNRQESSPRLFSDKFTWAISLLKAFKI